MSHARVIQSNGIELSGQKNATAFEHIYVENSPRFLSVAILGNQGSVSTVPISGKLTVPCGTGHFSRGTGFPSHGTGFPSRGITFPSLGMDSSRDENPVAWEEKHVAWEKIIYAGICIYVNCTPKVGL